MKKIISVLLSILIAVMCAVTAFASANVKAETTTTNESKNYVSLEFGDMVFDDTKELNEVWFRLNIQGNYENVEKFIIHFSLNKEVLQEDGIFGGDVTLDYKIQWQETDNGYDHIIYAWNCSDFKNILYYSGFRIIKPGVHNLSATAEVVYKNGDIEALDLLFDVLGDEVVDSSAISCEYDVNCDGEVTAADARLALRFSAKLEKYDYIQFKAADIDGNGQITAADARLILRKAAQLD